MKKYLFYFFIFICDFGQCMYVQEFEVYICCKGNLSQSVWCGPENVLYGVDYCASGCSNFYANVNNYALQAAQSSCINNGAVFISYNLLSYKCLGSDEFICGNYGGNFGASESESSYSAADLKNGNNYSFFSFHYGDDFRQWANETDIKIIENLKNPQIRKDNSLVNKLDSIINYIYRKVSKINENKKTYDSVYRPLYGNNSQKDLEYQYEYYKLIDIAKDRENIKNPVNKAEEIMKELNDEEEKNLDCSGFTAMIYQELALSTHTIRDCGDRSKEECLWCADEGYPCNRPSQKQYEYLKSYGKISDNIEEIKPGDILFFKECAKEEICPIVHVMFAKGKSEELEEDIDKKQNLDCTQDLCPVSTISTSKGRRIKKEDKFILKKGCYEYGCKKYDEEKEKCIERKKQCFVGGGRP